ncbi:glycosyltransferase [Persephonella sp. IF05-L8]|uniref:glycosyltransferase n=1 Tax=Persephonella sp. IF05-L8 TaxID=1158338 RepID=UPI000497998B
MKVLFYLHNLWDISATTRLSIDLANILKEKYNIDVEFAVNKRVDNDIKSLPFKLHVLNRKGEIGKAIALKNLIEKEKYDIVLSYMLTQNVILSLAKKFLKDKAKTVFLGSVHNSDNYMGNKQWYKLPYRYLMKRIYENLDGIIVVSAAVEEDVNKAFFVKKEKLKVIYNYIDIKKIKAMAQEDLTPEEKRIFEKPVVINVGRVEVQKGQEYLIKAFPKIKKEIKEAYLVIIGDGSLMPSLKELAKSLNIEKDTFFFGYKKNPFKYVVHSKVFAFPSLWEGVGNVVLEAQALGTPVVAFDSQGGHVDVLQNSGILVPEKNIDKLAENIIRLLKDENVRKHYSKLALENIRNYTVEKKAQEYFEYFNKKLREKYG